MAVAVTTETLAELRRRVQDHLMGYMVDCYGPSTLPRMEIERLVGLGIIDAASGEQLKADFLEDAFVAGMVVARLDDARLTISRPGTSYTSEQIAQELQRNPIALSEADKRAVEWARTGAALNCRHLGERAAQAAEDVAWTYSEAQRAADETQIREGTAQAVDERRTAKWLRGELGRRLGMYEQDLDRIACTELQDSHNEGAARGILAKHGDNAVVCKIPNPKACGKCRELYVDDDGNPKLFQLATLIANGTNVGRRKEEWLPVVGTTHPWCACVLRRVPSGFEFQGGVLVPIGAHR